MTRLLILPNPFRHINPTWELLIDELAVANPHLVIGPRTHIPCRSLKKIIQEKGPFDALIVDPWFFVKGASEEYNPIDIYDIDIPIILSLMQFDLHNLGKELLDLIRKKADIVISAGTGNDFFYRPNQRDYENEVWLNENQYANSDKGVFNKKYVLIPHCIGEHEFVNSEKKDDIIIPGVSYHFRKIAKEWIDKCEHIKVAETNDLLQKLLSRLILFRPMGNRISVLNRPIGLDMYHKRFVKKIAQSKLAITCDGSINYPIRKFFEIPAFGTLLAAKFFERPERLGFVSGENCYSLDESNLDAIADILKMMQSDSSEINRVKEAGQTMVRELHSVRVRAQQLVEFCGAIASAQANTMTWDDGKPVHSKENLSV